MDDLKLFSKSVEQMDPFMRTAHVSSAGIGMKFGMKKCGDLSMKKGKVVRYEEIKLPNSDVIKEAEKEEYEYFGIVE